MRNEPRAGHKLISIGARSGPHPWGGTGRGADPTPAPAPPSACPPASTRESDVSHSRLQWVLFLDSCRARAGYNFGGAWASVPPDIVLRQLGQRSGFRWSRVGGRASRTARRGRRPGDGWVRKTMARQRLRVMPDVVSRTVIASIVMGSFPSSLMSCQAWRVARHDTDRGLPMTNDQ